MSILNVPPKTRHRRWVVSEQRDTTDDTLSESQVKVEWLTSWAMWHLAMIAPLLIRLNHIGLDTDWSSSKLDPFVSINTVRLNCLSACGCGLADGQAVDQFLHHGSSVSLPHK